MRISKANVMGALIFAVLMATGPAPHATELTFDDLGNDIVTGIPDGYGGLNWSNMQSMNTSLISAYGPSGYINGTVSGTNVALNSGGTSASVSDGNFNFNGAYLTAAWNNGLNIQVTGYLDGVQKYDRVVVVNTYSPTYFDFDYADIDDLVFNAWGGDPAGYPGGGTYFAMDNFTFTERLAPVPEPGAVILLGAGFLALVIYGKRLKSACSTRNI